MDHGCDLNPQPRPVLLNYRHKLPKEISPSSSLYWWCPGNELICPCYLYFMAVVASQELVGKGEAPGVLFKLGFSLWG